MPVLLNQVGRFPGVFFSVPGMRVDNGYMVVPSSGGDTFSRWQGTQGLDGEIYAVAQTIPSDQDGMMGVLFMRWGGERQGAYAYTLSVLADTRSPSGYKLHVEDGQTTIANVYLSEYSHAVDYEFRFRVEGDQIKAKAWKFGTQEPGWLIEERYQSIPRDNGQFAGIYGYNSGETRVKLATFGYGGDKAPSWKDLSPPRPLLTDAINLFASSTPNLTPRSIFLLPSSSSPSKIQLEHTGDIWTVYNSKILLGTKPNEFTLGWTYNNFYVSTSCPAVEIVEDVYIRGDVKVDSTVEAFGSAPFRWLLDGNVAATGSTFTISPEMAGKSLSISDASGKTSKPVKVLVHELGGVHFKWKDDFDGPIDKNAWPDNDNFEVGGNQWGWSADSRFVQIKDSKVILTSARTPGWRRAVTGMGRLISRGGVLMHGGYIEARVKMNLDERAQFAFWMTPENDEYGIWPKSGEVDIVESWASTYHSAGLGAPYGERWPDKMVGDSVGYPMDISQWHTYGLYWRGNRMEYYIDGYLCSATNISGKYILPPAPFNMPFHFRLQQYWGNHGYLPWESGSYYDGVYGDMGSTEIDYVRLYDLDDEFKYPEIKVIETTFDECYAKRPLQINIPSNIRDNIPYRSKTYIRDIYRSETAGYIPSQGDIGSPVRYELTVTMPDGEIRRYIARGVVSEYKEKSTKSSFYYSSAYIVKPILSEGWRSIENSGSVWKDNRREDVSQWRKPVSTTRDDQEWRRVVYD